MAQRDSEVSRLNGAVSQTLGSVSGDGRAATLAELRVGSRGRILGLAVDAPPAVVRRLEDLGFTEGTTVEVVRRAPLRDPVIYRLRDYEVCLRRAQAACVRAEEVR